MNRWLDEHSSAGGIVESDLQVLRQFGHATLTIRFNLMRERDFHGSVGQLFAPPLLLVELKRLGEELTSDAYLSALTMAEYKAFAQRIHGIVPMLRQVSQVMNDLKAERAAPDCQYIALNTSGIETVLTLQPKKRYGYGVWVSVQFKLFLFCDPNKGAWLIGHSLDPKEAVLFMPWNSKEPRSTQVPTEKKWQRLDETAFGKAGYQSVNIQCVAYPYEICDCFHVSAESDTGAAPENVNGYYALTQIQHGRRPVWQHQGHGNQTLLYAEQQQGMTNATAPVNWVFGKDLLQENVRLAQQFSVYLI
jgi:hypothetical protein